MRDIPTRVGDAVHSLLAPGGDRLELERNMQ